MHGGEAGASTGVAVWGTAGWRALAVAWLDERLAAAGIRRTGQVQQPHLRAWATALTAPTTHGQVWLKAAGPGTAFEVGLYEVLYRAAPGRVLAPIATDPARGWILLPHGGRPLGEGVAGEELVDALVTVLPEYALLQRDVAPYTGELLASGVPDMTPATMPTRFDEALEVVGRYVERHGTAADRSACVRLTAGRAAYRAWCERLAELSGLLSVDHNDLHPWNMLVGRDGIRFYDWGDSVVAQPFASMLVTLRHLADHLGVADSDPQVCRVRDAYLEVFSDLAPHAELVAALGLARRLATVARALTWQRAISALPPDEAREYAGAPLGWLRSLLDDPSLVGLSGPFIESI